MTRLTPLVLCLLLSAYATGDSEAANAIDRLPLFNECLPMKGEASVTLDDSSEVEIDEKLLESFVRTKLHSEGLLSIGHRAKGLGALSLMVDVDRDEFRYLLFYFRFEANNSIAVPWTRRSVAFGDNTSVLSKYEEIYKETGDSIDSFLAEYLHVNEEACVG